MLGKHFSVGVHCGLQLVLSKTVRIGDTNNYTYMPPSHVTLAKTKSWF